MPDTAPVGKRPLALPVREAGPVRLLETPDGRRLGYSEGQQNGRLIADLKEVSLLYQRYDTLRSQTLNPNDSREPAGATPKSTVSTTELMWFKSSYSGTQGDDRVAVALTGQAVLVRDSKDKDGPQLAIGRNEWAQFVRFAAGG